MRYFLCAVLRIFACGFLRAWSQIRLCVVFPRYYLLVLKVRLGVIFSRSRPGVAKFGTLFRRRASRCSSATKANPAPRNTPVRRVQSCQITSPPRKTGPPGPNTCELPDLTVSGNCLLLLFREFRTSVRSALSSAVVFGARNGAALWE